MYVNNNFFVFGEVGKRLAGIRESEIARGSARHIRNLLVTELGNLKFAKQWKPTLKGDFTNVLQVLDTRYHFYIVVTSNRIITVRKDDDVELYHLDLETPLKYKDNIKMFEDSLISCGAIPKVYEFDKDTGNIGISNFLSLLKFPIVDKEEVQMEVFKVYNVDVAGQKELRVTSLSLYKNPKLESKTDGIYLFETNIKLDRVYKQSRSTIDKDTITGIHEGMVIGVFQRFYQKDGDKQYILGNSKIDFDGYQDDTLYGSGYYTSINVKNVNGELTYGELKNITTDIIDAGVFKGRMYIIQDNIFYFSKIDNFFDFRNDIKDDSAFFFRPSPINNQKPYLLTSKVGNAIYVATNKGVYVIGYGVKFLTPSTYTVFIAGEIPCTFECELINDNFYYISEDGVLKCVQPIPNQLGYENFQVFNVEKYSTSKNSKWLTKVIVDGVQKLVNVTGINYIELYDSLDINQFRKTSIDINHTTKLFGYNEDFVNEGKILNKTDLNYEEATLILNPPSLQTAKGGNYMNDYPSKIERVSIKMLNENNEAIKGVKIMDVPCNNLIGAEDDFNVYKVELQKSIGNGYNINIVSKQNNKTLEILGIDTFIRVSGD